MKILVMCEGHNEKAVVEMLLDAGRLKFSRDDLVVLNVYHARQLTSPIIKTNLNIYTGDFEVYRIGDTLTDKLSVPADYRGRIIRVKEIIRRDAPAELRDAAQQAYINTGINVCHSLMIEGAECRADLRRVRDMMARETADFSLLGRKRKLMANMIVHVPGLYRLIYVLYSKYFQKNVYS